MAENRVKILKGIIGNASGTPSGFTTQKNGVVRSLKFPIKRKRKRIKKKPTDFGQI